MCYANTPFRELAKSLTKAAYETARLVVCTPDWGPTGENTYWWNLLERLVVSRVSLLDMAIYIPKKDNKSLKKPDWTSQLSLIDGTIIHVPQENLDYPLLSCMAENKKWGLDDLKKKIPAY